MEPVLPTRHMIQFNCISTNTGRFRVVRVEYGYCPSQQRLRGIALVPTLTDDLAAAPSTTEAGSRTPTRPFEQFTEDVASSRHHGFQCFRGEKPPRFVNESERECAEILDFYGVPWEYEPVTFVLETAEDGRITEAFNPDFYLPEQNLFLEVTTMRQDLVTRKNRKVRKLRQRYPDVNVKLFYRRDIEALGHKLNSRGTSTAPARSHDASVHA